MGKAKQWIALTAVGVLAVLAASWFLLISPKRTEAADIRDLTAQQVSQNSGLQAQLVRLKQQASELPKKQAELAAVAAKIPDNPALPALVRALTKAADEAGVELVSMAPGTPTDVAVEAAVPATPVAGGATSAASSPKAPTSRSTASTAAAASAGRLQSIALNLQVVGGYFQIEQFVDRLEALSRAFKTTTLKLAPGENPVKPRPASGGTAVSDGRTLQATLVGSVYMASGRGLVAAPVVPVK